MLRVGVDTFANAETPVPVRCAMVARLAMTNEAGPHKIELRITDGNVDLFPPIFVDFDAPAEDVRLNLIHQWQTTIPKHGRFRISLSVDGKELDHLFIKTVPALEGAMKS